MTSDPVGIDCPNDCEEPFAPGTRVTLRATATSGYSLDKWHVFPDDPGCEQQTCEVTVAPTGDTSVDVVFHPAAQLSVVPRGAGTMTISPGETSGTALCDVDFQEDLADSCSHRYVPGTSVTLTAHEDDGGTFIGWTDYRCANSSRICRIRVTGERFIAARFTPVRLRINAGAFGSVTVNPPRGGFCALLETSPLCEFEYRADTVVRLRREHGAAGQYWVGACQGHTGALLDADVCRLRLHSNELVAAGKDNVAAIPPAKRSGITVTLGGNKRGRVRGGLVNGTQTLSCPPRCQISRASDYDSVRLVARALRGSRFVRWSGGSRLSRRIVSLDAANRIRATFASRRR